MLMILAGVVIGSGLKTLFQSEHFNNRFACENTRIAAAISGDLLHPPLYGSTRLMLPCAVFRPGWKAPVPYPVRALTASLSFLQATFPGSFIR